MKKHTLSIINNILIVIFVTVATILMINGIHFMKNALTLEVSGYRNLKFFTVQSNIFIGIAAFIFLIYEILLLKKKIKKIPTWVYVLKHVATTSVAITFFVTLFYLGPTIESGFLSLYTNSNLFFHLIIPLLAMLGYVLLDKYDNKYRYCLYSLIPIALYSIYYIPNVLTHLNNGVTNPAYDFYGFFHGKPINILLYYPLIILVAYGLSTLLYTFNIKLLKK